MTEPFVWRDKRLEQAPNLYNPLSLAYLGDAVYSLLVRDRLQPGNTRRRPACCTGMPRGM